MKSEAKNKEESVKKKKKVKLLYSNEDGKMGNFQFLLFVLFKTTDWFQMNHNVICTLKPCMLFTKAIDFWM